MERRSLDCRRTQIAGASVDADAGSELVGWSFDVSNGAVQAADLRSFRKRAVSALHSKVFETPRPGRTRAVAPGPCEGRVVQRESVVEQVVVRVAPAKHNHHPKLLVRHRGVAVPRSRNVSCGKNNPRALPIREKIIIWRRLSLCMGLCNQTISRTRMPRRGSWSHQGQRVGIVFTTVTKHMEEVMSAVNRTNN